MKKHTETLDLEPRAQKRVVFQPALPSVLRNVVLESGGSPVYVEFVSVGDRIVARWDTRDPAVKTHELVAVCLRNEGGELGRVRVIFEYEESEDA